MHANANVNGRSHIEIFRSGFPRAVVYLVLVLVLELYSYL